MDLKQIEQGLEDAKLVCSVMVQAEAENKAAEDRRYRRSTLLAWVSICLSLVGIALSVIALVFS